MALKWKNKILLAKLEASYGVDPVPTAAEGILATGVTLTPMEGNDLGRDLDLPYFGAQPTIPVELHAKLAFKVELAGSGTAGTAPAWGPLLRACAMAETVDPGVSVVYNPITDAPESVAIYLWIDGTRYVLLGARGTCKLMIGAQQIPYLEFEFTGLFSIPTEAARVIPTLTGFKKPLAGTKANTPTFTLDGTSCVLRSFMLDLANQIEPRFLIGTEGILITDKLEAIEATIEALPLTTFDPYTLAAGQTTLAIALVHGTAAGNIAAIDVPAAQMQRPQGLSNAQNIVEWALRMVPQPVAGNDQFTLTLT